MGNSMLLFYLFHVGQHTSLCHFDYPFESSLGIDVVAAAL